MRLGILLRGLLPLTLLGAAAMTGCGPEPLAIDLESSEALVAPPANVGEPSNTITSVKSYTGRAALTAHRDAILAALKSTTSDLRRNELRGRLERIDAVLASGGPLTLNATTSEGCEGAETCGDDPTAVIIDTDLTVTVAQVSAYVSGQGFLINTPICNEVTVYVDPTLVVPDCGPDWGGSTLTTQVQLNLTYCPDSTPGELKASAVHSIGSDVAYSNEKTPCGDHEETLSEPAAGYGEADADDTYCLVTKYYINGELKAVKVHWCA